MYLMAFIVYLTLKSISINVCKSVLLCMLFSWCVCVVHIYCSAQMSMFQMEKRYRNKIIIIIIIVIINASCELGPVGSPVAVLESVSPRVFLQAVTSSTIGWRGLSCGMVCCLHV